MKPSREFRLQHKRTTWIVVDRGCRVVARVQNADFGEALSIARTAFPEFPDGDLLVVLRRKASSIWREESEGAVLLMPQSCAKQGLSQLLLEWEAKRLQAILAASLRSNANRSKHERSVIKSLSGALAGVANEIESHLPPASGREPERADFRATLRWTVRRGREFRKVELGSGCPFDQLVGIERHRTGRSLENAGVFVLGADGAQVCGNAMEVGGVR